MAGAVIPLIEPNPDADVGVRITNVSYCTTLRYLRDMGLVQIQHGLIHVPATLYRPLVLGLSTAVQQATELLTDFE